MAFLTRRTFMGLMGVAALTPVLGGCSSEEPATAQEGGQAADTSVNANGMRTVDTDKGQVEIPANPQTIVSDYYLGELLAVDVKPVIASPYALNNPFLAGLCDGIEELNTVSAETSLEMIAEKEPDLIITITEADYDKYSKIAPTVYIQDGKRSDEDLFRYIASLVNKEDAAEAYINEFNDQVAMVKDEMVSIVGDRTVSILEVWPQEIYTMGSRFARGGSILYDMWGLKAPEPIQSTMVDGDETYKVISVEALPDYAGDFILYGVLDSADSAYVDDSKLWQNLPAVKADRVLPYEQVAFMHRDPITLSHQLDIFVDFFRAHENDAA
ncbi:ABC transporter substrate-binding protein [Adlercreutzia equolifaciens]|uniref:ABC transporter substrate-binding protein n=1 Tax=Adlercreutzia equolifaciens TaxID=446660 RepID=UPI0023AF1E1C|nr:ABC transporter substrate-binding protein [Adlercreutzia equolifaciens]MDE8703241.1 ABC transporter substrate-binding protein [Adlercreutzia equolifaciens]